MERSNIKRIWAVPLGGEHVRAETAGVGLCCCFLLWQDARLYKAGGTQNQRGVHTPGTRFYHLFIKMLRFSWEISFCGAV